MPAFFHVWSMLYLLGTTTSSRIAAASRLVRADDVFSVKVGTRHVDV
ncbi:hypothetical protein SAMN04488115_101652 [Bosea lathyri]|uniref:Uncharacterized protein n=1 Tax=Bosea lathyri TaxID=1036778 RepID=A0A1H5TIH7_9HYPH|nr:hypothetical protein SAMN04488115_101652 [Bosea lathyri]